MFFLAAVPLAAPLTLARTRLHDRNDLERLLREASRTAFTEFLRPTSTPPALADREIEVLSLPAYRRAESSVVPLRWFGRWAGADAIPVLDANVELQPRGGTGSQLTLLGSYELPSLLRGASDREAQQVVIQAAAVRLLSRVAGEIDAGL